MSALPGDYPSNDLDFGSDNEAGWFCSVKVVEKAFEGCNIPNRGYEIYTERYYADAVVVDVQAGDCPPAKLYPAAQLIRRGLREIGNYFRVSVWLNCHTERVLWLEVDRHGMYVHLGRRETEQFDNLNEFYRHFWGADFGVPS